jgi:rhodanese-related sulfurtransferase
MSEDTSAPGAPAEERPAITRIPVGEARTLVAAGRGVLVDTRDRRLYDNAHAAGAISLPLSEIEAAHGRIRADAVPPDRLLILYCA